MKIKFREIKLSKNNLIRLEQINSIIKDYQNEGYVLTLRQLYYQLVSKDIIPNKQEEYSKLSTLLKEGRMGGIIDWEAIEDRLRQPYRPPSFNSPKNILDAAINQFELPRMKGQDTYLEVWVEKDALSGVLKRVTKKYHIPLIVNRGYSSVSAMFDAYNRFRNGLEEDAEKIIVLYLGDFDPSGLDMIRDIKERIEEFSYSYYEFTFPFEIIPIALTKDQIDKYTPPPNPAKITDPRAKDFISKYGSTSWEVDALPPNILHELLENSIKEYINIDKYDDILSKEFKDKLKLKSLKKYL